MFTCSHRPFTSGFPPDTCTPGFFTFGRASLTGGEWVITNGEIILPVPRQLCRSGVLKILYPCTSQISCLLALAGHLLAVPIRILSLQVYLLSDELALLAESWKLLAKRIILPVIYILNRHVAKVF